ncbi:hypothetical protein ACXYMX_12515 [Sporosarcina sp. CAU 1771]
MIDLLTLLNDSKINEDKAYKIFDEVMERFHDGDLDIEPQEYLLLNEFEYTAFCHTAGLQIIAKWRKEGWPKFCNLCRKDINHKKYGWTIKNDKLVCLDWIS